jgi:hypothetical protein
MDKRDKYIEMYPNCDTCGNCKPVDRSGYGQKDRCMITNWFVDSFNFKNEVIKLIGCRSWKPKVKV